MTDTGDFTHAGTPVCPPGVGSIAFSPHGSIATASLRALCAPPPAPPPAVANLTGRLEALERHVADLALLADRQGREMETLRQNDARLTQENITLRQMLNGTGGRAYETNADVW